ncbi:MAG: hypothetical protein GY862_32035 [Gammaproteobacteria bacterium]|nr:hypothetical protein [Gammaproteobacteria bacterium]
MPAIRHAGLSILNRELGPAGMIRFLQQFETGQGDYSKDRHQWQDKQTVSDLLALLTKKQSCQS